MSYGADLHGEDEDGNTPLHVAIFRLRSSELGTLEDKLIRSEQDPSDGAPLIADVSRCVPAPNSIMSVCFVCRPMLFSCVVYACTHVCLGITGLILSVADR